MAFHGSPASPFAKFTTDKIGSGEGAQAFGWGLYFAGRREVADWYRTTLAPLKAANMPQSRAITDLPSRDEQKLLGVVNGAMKIMLSAISGDYFKNFWFTHFRSMIAFYNFAGETAAFDARYQSEMQEEITRRVQNITPAYERDPKSFLELVEYTPSDIKWPVRTAYHYAVKAMSAHLKDTGQSGTVYEVSLPPDDHFLRWDDDIASQPAFVRSKIGSASGTGQAFYRALTGEKGSPKDASLFLSRLGIAGIKYLDGASRNVGDGTYNYVVFDEEMISIISSQTD